MNVQVQRMYRFETDRPLKAFVDLIIDDCLLIKGVKVLEGKNGLFVTMPQEQAKDKKWYDSVRCLTEEVRDKITHAVLGAYSEDDEYEETMSLISEQIKGELNGLQATDSGA